MFLSLSLSLVYFHILNLLLFTIKWKRIATEYTYIKSLIKKKQPWTPENEHPNASWVQYTLNCYSLRCWVFFSFLLITPCKTSYAISLVGLDVSITTHKWLDFNYKFAYLFGRFVTNSWLVHWVRLVTSGL